MDGEYPSNAHEIQINQNFEEDINSEPSERSRGRFHALVTIMQIMLLYKYSVCYILVHSSGIMAPLVGSCSELLEQVGDASSLLFFFIVFLDE